MPIQPKSISVTLLLPFLSLLFLATLTTQAEAQLRHSRQPLQAGFRWLGQGHSAGYHWKNPGPNSDYYNPYTAHNSMLISQSHGQYGYGQFGQGVPPSVYAPTRGSYKQHLGYGQNPGQTLTPSFVPSDQDDDPSDSEDDMPKIKSDPNEPGSIMADETGDDDEDADFEEVEDDSDDWSDEGEDTKTLAPAPNPDQALDFSSFRIE